MENSTNIVRKSSQHISFGTYGLLSMLFGGLGDLIAYLLYPGYDFRRRAVSSLCLGPGWLFFQVGTVLSGLFALLFLINLEKTFNDKEINERLRKYAKFSGTISCMSFIILGVFCGSNVIIAYIHGINAVISWITGLGYITLFNILFLKSPKYSKFVAYGGFIVTLTMSLLLITFLLSLSSTFRFLIKILAELEWLNTIALIFWYFLVSTYIIYKAI
ncbi:MAG: hypothetical protein ACFFB0_14365 [Promethearchaeota archaeon]